jgi:hypothetical protein
VGHVGHPENRWYHSSLQIIAFENGKAAILCNYGAYLDGDVMTRGASEILKRSKTLDVVPIPEGPEAANRPHWHALKWRYEPALLAKSREDLDAILTDTEATFDIPGVGAEALKRAGLDPVTAFIAAVACAVRRLEGRHVSVEQFVARSKFRVMDTALVRVPSPELETLADYLVSVSDPEAHRTMELLSRSVEAQADAYRQARATLDPQTTITFFRESLQGVRKLWVNAILFCILRTARRRLARVRAHEVILSFPHPQPGVLLTGRPGVRMPAGCFGGHYEILPDCIRLTLLPAPNWRNSNDDLAVEIERCLQIFIASAEGSRTVAAPAAASGR